MIRLIGCVTIIILIPMMVLGAGFSSDTFRARLLVGTDVMPPSTPVITVVEAVSPFQIDLAWSPSVDDVYVAGYRVYRDAVVIATTTQTSFTDGSLSSSTLYTYTIDAFDTSYNFSSTSVPEATTTLALPPVPVVVPIATTTNTNSNPTAVNALRNVSVTGATTSAKLNLSSYGPVNYLVRWGRTTSYELGSIASSIMRREQSLTLEGLEPGTKYFYEISLINSRGIKTVVAEDTFTTASLYTQVTKLNVANPFLRVEGDTVSLRWQAPAVPYQNIRIVRSHLFYPLSVEDGVTVYLGRGDAFVDENVLRDRAPYFYTIFVTYADGTVSSGVTLRADRNEPTGLSNKQNESVVSSDVPPPPGDEFDQGEMALLSSGDVYIATPQTVMTLNEKVVIPTATPVLIYIPKSAVPTDLKAILVSVTNPTNHQAVSVYLLKLSPDGTRYETEFISSPSEGEAMFEVALYNFLKAEVRRIGKRIEYTNRTFDESRSVMLGIPKDQLAVVATATGLVGFVLVGGVWLWWWRRREDNR